MNHKQTVDILLKGCPSFKKAYDRISAWNPNLSVRENVEIIGLGIGGWAFSYKYKLPSKKVSKIRDFYKKKHFETRDKWAKKWDTNSTIAQNAKRCGVSAMNAHHISRRYGFPYLKITKCGQRIAIAKQRDQDRTIKIRALDELGFSQTQIAHIMGFSRQRINQLG